MIIVAVVLATGMVLGWIKAFAEEARSRDLTRKLAVADVRAVEQARRIVDLRSRLAWHGGTPR